MSEPKPEHLTSVVVACGLSKRYSSVDRAVLSDVSLTVEAGELVAILGPSGAGKSTLLHVIAGIDEPDSGEVTVAGVDVANLGEVERARFRGEYIGFVFQQFHLLPHLRAWENVAVPAVLRGGRAARHEERARRSLTSFGLADRADQMPSQMSGGELQRVAIARALVNDPVLVLADEPTGSLDTANGERVHQTLRAAADQGVAVVVVSHDPTVLDVADRAVQMQDGEILPHGVAR